MVESIFYSLQVKPIMLTDDFGEGSIEACNLMSQGFKWKIHPIQSNPQPMIQLIDES